MAPNRHFLAPSDEKHDAGIYHCVCCGAALFDSRQQSLILGLAGPAFTRQWIKAPIEETEDNSFFMRRTEVHCSAPVMRILVMCFQMGRSQLGFVIASIRRHLIFKETNERKFSPRSQFIRQTVL